MMVVSSLVSWVCSQVLSGDAMWPLSCGVVGTATGLSGLHSLDAPAVNGGVVTKAMSRFGDFKKPK